MSSAFPSIAGGGATGQALRAIRDHLKQLSFPLDLPRSDDAREDTVDVLRQLDDYILPRFESLDAPILAVVGGSTGSGKSTLVNSLVRSHVARSSAIRPTTRRPLLVHHTRDSEWFEGDRILPGLARVHGSSDAADSSTELGLVATQSIPPGLALLDSPDIDSVVEDNRRLAAQLMAAADMWLFVTTAARYADAIPWGMLDDAADRNVVIGVVLNRVPPGVGAEVRSDLSRRLSERGLDHAPLFVISETHFDEEGFLRDADIQPIRVWLAGIAHDAGARASVARQTLGGAVATVSHRARSLVPALQEQTDSLIVLASQVDDAFAQSHARIMHSIEDGSLLRGEVLARWQEFVGTGEILRQIEAGVGRIRDRLTDWFRGAPARNPDQVEGAIEDGVLAMLVGEADRAIAEVERTWARGAGGEELTQIARAELRTPEERRDAAGTLVREWQRGIMETIRSEGADKRTSARILSAGINTIGVALMVVIFASTAGLTGGEIAVAGGTAVVAQKVLEAVFGRVSPH